jgi:hypothetical protein
LKVAYVNNVFLEIIEDGHRSEEEPSDVAENFISILQERCINPPLSRFIKWIEGVAQAPESMHHLKTRFKGFTPTTEGPITGSAMQFIDIEWNAVIMEKRFIVLTGRTTGTVQFVTSLSSPSELATPSLVGSGIPSPPVGEVLEGGMTVPTNTDPPPPVPMSPSSSSSRGSKYRRKKAIRTISSNSTGSERSRMSSVTELEELEGATGYGVDTWQTKEKVFPFVFELLTSVR